MANSLAQGELGLKEGFYRDFQLQVAELQEQIDKLNVTSAGSERIEAIDDCLAGIDRLSYEVKDASTYIPAYDQRSYSQTIKALSEKLQTTRNSFGPPKKFSFKSRRNAPVTPVPSSGEQSQEAKPAHSDATTNDASTVSSMPEKGQDEDVVSDGIQDGPGVRRPSLSTASKIIITNHTHLHVRLPAEAAHATSSGTVSNLQHCVVDLAAPTTSAPFSALYLKNIKNSVIICGQTAGAVHITDVDNSVLVLSCRQFRMHGSKKVDVYLHSASRPIIEDCEGVRFAPMPQALATPAMAQVANRWDHIDDFKWLKAEASPNFSLLEEAQRVEDGVWRDKVVGSEDREDVLRVLGVEQF
ncbi:tubulin-specific chaperone-like protein c [Phaeosphaeria sp. MPI-PUGE-AT-0046c]|nr:tubulin-specific chaperone-like protein c [Phaeosphaeria sp. MPI-PUGE-AT-0046c]